MKKIIYTEKEKELLINFFITEGMNSKKNFKEYIQYYFNTHGTRVANKYEGRRIEGAWSELGNFELEEVEYLWGNENNDNLVTYLYSQNKFQPSASKIKNIEKLKVNFNHITNKGENILFYTRMYHLNDTQELIEKYKIDTELKNIHGEIFYTHIFDKYYSNSKDLHDTRVEETRLEDTMNFIAQYNHLLQYINQEQIEYIKQKFHECVDKIEKRLYEVAAKENKGTNYSYDDDKINDNLPYKEHRNFMDKIFNYHILNKKLIIDESKEKVKKLKI